MLVTAIEIISERTIMIIWNYKQNCQNPHIYNENLKTNFGKCPAHTPPRGAGDWFAMKNGNTFSFCFSYPDGKRADQTIHAELSTKDPLPIVCQY